MNLSNNNNNLNNNTINAKKVIELELELKKLTKKLNTLEFQNEKTIKVQSEEITYRQNIEKKIFLINENLSNKISLIEKSNANTMVNILKKEQDNLPNFNNDIFIKENFKETTLHHDIVSLTNKSEIDLIKSIHEIKKENIEYNIKVNRIEENFVNHFNNLSKDLIKVNSNVNEIKEITDVLKTFKENVLLNFKDIANEFTKMYLTYLI